MASTAPALTDKYKPAHDSLVAAHNERIDSLVRAALELPDQPDQRWVDRRRAGSQYGYEDLVGYLTLMLLGMDQLVLDDFVKGDLAQANC